MLVGAAGAVAVTEARVSPGVLMKAPVERRGRARGGGAAARPGAGAGPAEVAGTPGKVTVTTGSPGTRVGRLIVVGPLAGPGLERLMVATGALGAAPGAAAGELTIEQRVNAEGGSTCGTGHTGPGQQTLRNAPGMNKPRGVVAQGTSPSGHVGAADRAREITKSGFVTGEKSCRTPLSNCAWICTFKDTLVRALRSMLIL